ncbi:hypothetical protein MRX96_028291 [Rhipicephalus microplus]
MPNAFIQLHPHFQPRDHPEEVKRVRMTHRWCAAEATRREFRKIFQIADSDPSHFEQPKVNLDGLVKTDDWDLDHAV